MKTNTILSVILAITMLFSFGAHTAFAALDGAELIIDDYAVGGTTSVTGAQYTVTKTATVGTDGSITPIARTLVGTYPSGTTPITLDQHAVYEVVQTTRAPGYYLNTTVMTIEYPFMVDGAIALDQTVTIHPKLSPVLGTVELTKYVDNTATILAGAIFDLYEIVDPTGVTPDVKVNTADLITDTTGKIKVQDLPEGNYYLIETSAPTPYLFDELQEYPFTVTVDSTGTSLAAISPITAQNFTSPTALTHTKVVNGAGTATLPIGSEVTYTITYKLPADIDLFSTYTITDILPASLSYESASISPTAGFTLGYDTTTKTVTANITDFTLVTPSTDVILTIVATINTTATNGSTISNTASLAWDNGLGDSGTVTSDTPTVSVAGAKIQVYVHNGTPSPLAGAQVVLVDSAGNPILDGSGNQYTGTTDGTGYYTYADLPVGTYYVKQVKATTGYRINETLSEVIVTESKTYTVDILNYSTTQSYPTTGTFTRYLMYAAGIGLIIFFVIYRKRRQRND